MFFHPCSLTRRKVTTPEVNSRADSSDGVVDNTKSGANKPAVTCQDACPLIKKKQLRPAISFEMVNIFITINKESLQSTMTCGL